MRLYSLCVALFLAACSSAPTTQVPFAYPPELIQGEMAFGERVPAAESLPLLDVSPEMAAFVDANVASSYFGFTRFRRLLAKMVDHGFFIDQYDRSATYTAQRTFQVRKGNCIAYTNMFIALAREAGLDASYQLVDSRPTWNVESGFLVRNNHVNVLLRGLAVPGMSDGELTVDFNTYEADPKSRKRTISDAYAASMFYANLSVERLQAGDRRGAFSFLKRAILTEPNNVDLWNNLGVLYSILGKPELGQAAYETALSVDERDKSALSGMAKTLRQQNRLAEADVYESLSKAYQRKNPYYHYAIAEQAYLNKAFDEALVAVNQAIALKKNNARFYGLRAATAQELGDEVLAQRSLKLQARHHRGGKPAVTPWLSN